MKGEYVVSEANRKSIANEILANHEEKSLAFANKREGIEDSNETQPEPEKEKISWAKKTFKRIKTFLSRKKDGDIQKNDAVSLSEQQKQSNQENQAKQSEQQKEAALISKKLEKSLDEIVKVKQVLEKHGAKFDADNSSPKATHNKEHNKGRSI